MSLRAFLLVVAGMVATAGAALLTSALLDRPATRVRTEVVIDAPRPVVWGLLTDFGRYGSWNPYITEARGKARVGTTIRLRLEPTNRDAREADCEVVVVNGMRKLEFVCRTYRLPGVLDREHIFRLLPVSSRRMRLVYEGRWEGLLVPFADLEARQTGYVDMARALKQRAEASS